MLTYLGLQPHSGSGPSRPPEIGRPINILAYCVHEGFASSRSEGDELQAVKDWTCIRADGTSEPIKDKGRLSWTEACQYQYGPAVVATNTAPDDPWDTVRCVNG
ncbi:hypothetical protein [Streptomyces sp. NPDC051079]|uniref:hypothetical protein n=1 Tax=Streptomyces sp. NPDC051079 TaxID=3155043 RepID=UPI0034510926